MWTTPSLPYDCDQSLLPAPLPTTSDIHNASSVFVDGASKVVQVREHFVVKYGPQLQRRIQEGFNMIFIGQHMASSTPLVYAVYEEKGNAYIIMQYIPGRTLEDLWPSLRPHEREEILGQLRHALDHMRSLAPPLPSFYGSVGHGPIQYFLFWTMEPQQNINGPFATEKDFYLALVEKLHRDRSQQHPSRVEWLRTHLPASLTNHPPTFTHGDIQQKNIMVSRTDSDDPSHPSFKLSIIDWEDAGWYPDFFEYFICYTSFRWDDDWPQMIENCLDPFPVETMVLLPIYHEIFF